MIKAELFDLPIKHRLFVFNYVNLVFSAISATDKPDNSGQKDQRVDSYLQKYFPERPGSFSNFPLGQYHISKVYEYFLGDRSKDAQKEYAFFLGTHCPENQYRLLEHMIKVNPTVQKSLEDVANFYNLINPNHYLIISGEQIFLYTKYPKQEFDCAALFFEFSWILKNLNNSFKLQSIPFKDINIEERALSLKLNRNDFKLKSKRPDKNLKKILHRQAYQTLKQLFGFDYSSLENEQLSLAIEYLLRNLQGKQVGIHELASHLGLSERTLQRKLESEDLSFTKLTQFIRNEVAKQMLEVPIFKITDIAQGLGYSESSAFTRAFKKNTGISPLKYRKQFINA